MYTVYISGTGDPDIAAAFGEKYEITDDPDQSNIILSYDGKITDEMFSSRLVFAVVDMSDGGFDEAAVKCCSEHGAVLFVGVHHQIDHEQLLHHARGLEHVEVERVVLGAPVGGEAATDNGRCAGINNDGRGQQEDGG